MNDKIDAVRQEINKIVSQIENENNLRRIFFFVYRILELEEEKKK